MNPTLKKILRPANFFLEQIGINPRKLSNLAYLPRFIRDCMRFKKEGGHISRLFPVFSDYRAEAGSTDGHYFQQDLYFAQRIFSQNPYRHIDIGSRIDGFVSHIASFREIEVFDIRPLAKEIKNITFRRADLMSLQHEFNSCCDSLSCLHAIEHFGLGRYGDPINLEGHSQALANLAKMLNVGGHLYVSTPIGRPRIEFNAHRVFAPDEIINLVSHNGMELIDFAYIDDDDILHESDPESDLTVIDQRLSNMDYGCGMYTFQKKSTR